MPDCVEKPSPEDPSIEKDVLETDAVELWLSHELRLVELPVEHSKPNDGNAREDDVVKLVHIDIIDDGSREVREESKHEDWHHVENILVEHIRN